MPPRKRLRLLLGASLLAMTPVGGALAQSPAVGSFHTPKPAIIKGPYLQALGSGGVTVKVELDKPAPAKLEVFAPGGAAPVATRESTEALSMHALRVTGLSPATSYEYRVTVAGLASEPARFTTAPVDDRPFRFLAYGDSRSDPAAHAAVVRAMAAAPGDFLVNTGDMVAKGSEPDDWRELFSIEGPMLRDRCVFVSVGNHELTRSDGSGQMAFLRYFAGEEEGKEVERLYSTMRWGNTRFFLLNAMDNWTGEERRWLREELTRADREPGLVHRIAVMHWGPFSSGPHGPNKALADGEVLAAMREHHVDLVLAGHDHDYERGAGAGIKYLVTGGAGAPLYDRKRMLPETRRFDKVHHFVEVAVSGDHVGIVARRVAGGEIETCGFTGDGPWDCDAAAVAPTSTAATASPLSPPASPGPARAACSCSVPGSGGGRAGAVALALAAMLALARRRR